MAGPDGISISEDAGLVVGSAAAARPIRLRQAVLWGLMLRNPTEAVTVPRPTRREMHTLTKDEVGRLFEATRGHRLHALWVLLATTGLRLGEARGLRWSDIDFANGRPVVNRALQRQTGTGFVFAEPKTTRSRRTVYLARERSPPCPSIAGGRSRISSRQVRSGATAA